MAQRIALGFLLDKILKDVTSNVNDEHKQKIEKDVDKRLISIFGSDWSKLPATGPRLMTMVIILNFVLLPFGIVPATLINVAIAKSKEFNVEDKFVKILDNARFSKEDSKEKLNEILDYAGLAGKNVKEKLKDISDEAGNLFTKLFSQGKKFLGKLNIRKTDNMLNNNNSH